MSTRAEQLAAAKARAQRLLARPLVPYANDFERRARHEANHVTVMCACDCGASIKSVTGPGGVLYLHPPADRLVRASIALAGLFSDLDRVEADRALNDWQVLAAKLSATDFQLLTGAIHPYDEPNSIQRVAEAGAFAAGYLTLYRRQRDLIADALLRNHILDGTDILALFYAVPGPGG